MKNIFKVLAITFVALVGFSFIACSGDDGGGTGTYIITGSGDAFTATKNGAAVGSGSLEAVTTAIRTDANGTDCAIQLGNGTDVLNITGSTFGFLNSSVTWGNITLSGKMSSSTSSSSMIFINGEVSINSTADIAFTGSSAPVIYIYSSNGSLTVSGGSITSTNATTLATISNSGILNINGGTVSAACSSTLVNYNVTAIQNLSSGTLTINAGTVSATTNGTGSTYAVYNNGGTVTIAQGATIIGSMYGVN